MRKMRKVKKFIAAVLSTAIVCSCNVLPVLADPATNEITGNGNNDIEVSLTVASSYSVRLPASISLTYDDEQKKYVGSGNIEAKGIIESTKYVKIGIDGAYALVKVFPLSNSGSTTNVMANASMTAKGSKWMSQTAAGESSEDTYTLLKGYYEATTPLSVTCDIPDEPDTYTANIAIYFTLDDIS